MDDYDKMGFLSRVYNFARCGMVTIFKQFGFSQYKAEIEFNNYQKNNILDEVPKNGNGKGNLESRVRKII